MADTPFIIRGVVNKAMNEMQAGSRTGPAHNFDQLVETMPWWQKMVMATVNEVYTRNNATNPGRTNARRGGASGLFVPLDAATPTLLPKSMEESVLSRIPEAVVLFRNIRIPKLSFVPPDSPAARDQVNQVQNSSQPTLLGALASASRPDLAVQALTYDRVRHAQKNAQEAFGRLINFSASRPAESPPAPSVSARSNVLPPPNTNLPTQDSLGAPPRALQGYEITRNPLALGLPLPNFGFNQLENVSSHV